MRTSIYSVNLTKALPPHNVQDGVVNITVYPRLHFFSFDLSEQQGIIRHGSMGCSMSNCPITIQVSRSHCDAISSNIDINTIDQKIDFSRIRQFIHSDSHWKVDIHCDLSIPQLHTGIGISTQILCGVLWGCAQAEHQTLFIKDLFRFGLGNTSTLGIKLFFSPSFMIEMGLKRSGMIDVSAYHVGHFPFYIIVGIPQKTVSLSGQIEDDFWDKILPNKVENTYSVLYTFMMDTMTSIIQSDFSEFANSIHRLNAINTKKFEESIQDASIQNTMLDLRKFFGVASVSSMGPTIYAFSSKNPRQILQTLPNHNMRFFVLNGDKHD